MSESYLDRPQDDNTHKAHPAFKRGKITGVVSMLKIVKDIIEGIDTGEGVNNSPPVEDVRRAILEYKTALEDSSIDSKEAKKSLKKAKTLVAKVQI